VLITPITRSQAEAQSTGVKITTVQMDRVLPTVKSINYMGAVMAVEKAKAQGAVEAVYQTSTGLLTEGTRANLFVFKGNQLITPKTDVLAGITRAVVLEIAEDDFDVVEADIHYADIENGTIDEVFITSSTKEVYPVVMVNDIPIGNGKPGPKTEKLLQLFHSYVAQARQ
jgi:branched-chain amino acid aminotransferase